MTTTASQGLSIGSERRTRRSDEHGMALRYQLESTLRQGKMDAVALADTSGLLLAWAGAHPTCVELGALAPLVARGAPPRLSKVASPGDMTVRAIDCFGQALYLASIGGGVARDALLAHSARGIERILTAN